MTVCARPSAASSPRAIAASASSPAIRLAIGEVAAARTAAVATSANIEDAPDFAGLPGGLAGPGRGVLFLRVLFAGTDFAAARPAADFGAALPTFFLPLARGAGFATLFLLFTALTAAPFFLLALFGAVFDLFLVRAAELLRLAIVSLLELRSCPPPIKSGVNSSGHPVTLSGA